MLAGGEFPIMHEYKIGIVVGVVMVKVVVRVGLDIYITLDVGLRMRRLNVEVGAVDTGLTNPSTATLTVLDATF